MSRDRTSEPHRAAPSLPLGRRLHEVAVEGEVPFHDVDGMRIVWHGHYFKYFELARTALLRAVDLDVGTLIGPRYRFAVIESKCRYAWPLRYGERFRCAAWVEDFHRRLMIRYEITNLTAARRAARGHTVLAILDENDALLLETPREIASRFAG